MKFEWEHISDEKSIASVGEWTLTARNMGRSWVGCIERPCLVESPPLVYREDAERAAERMLRELVAPFVESAVEAEREACAEIADDVSDSDVSGYASLGARDVAKAIRARRDGAK